MNTIDACDGPISSTKKSIPPQKFKNPETALFTQMEIIVQTIYIVAERPNHSSKKDGTGSQKAVQERKLAEFTHIGIFVTINQREISREGSLIAVRV